MDQDFELHSGVVFPRHCDHLGHMNVRYYVHHFDDSSFHLWHKIGVNQKCLRDAGVCLVVANIDVNYIHELTAGDLLVIRGTFTRVGTRSIGHFQEMYNAETGVLCATQGTVEVFFNLKTRESTEMPGDIREILDAVVGKA